MMSNSSNQFGLIVAYLLPGFIGLAGIAPLVPVVRAWLVPVTYAEASLGPPIYAVLAATTLGMFLSCFRWLLIDHVHQWTGVRPPRWDDRQLQAHLAAFNYLVESHYRYYQFVANSLVGVLFSYLINRMLGTLQVLGIVTDVACVAVCGALFAASRDALTKYYGRTSKLIGSAR
jgi:hypothetical protein